MLLRAKAVEGNLVIFDYKATIDGKDFTGGEGKNTQLILGKDLFIKGFDKQLIGVKKNDEKICRALLYLKIIHKKNSQIKKLILIVRL